MRQPLAVWVFGPIGAGKSSVLSQLPLAGFQRVDQDALLESALSSRGLSLDTTSHSADDHAEFGRLRAAAAARAWAAVPAWRESGENLAFETTGDKPALFREAIEAGRRHGYQTLALGLRRPLAECLARNARRTRVLPAAVARASWEAFEQNCAAGVYAALLATESFHLCTDSQQAVSFARAWLLQHPPLRAEPSAPE